MAGVGHRRTSVGRYLPLAYLVAAVALAAALLPSVLRPPQDLQSTTAAFSPDAPPDDQPPEALIQALRQASSATAGGAPEEEIIEEEVVVVEHVPAVEPRATRGRCFGDPPRQTESLYSALCIPAWTGVDNGGATAPGVSADEVRVAIAVGSSSRTPEGRLDREFDSDDLSEEHDLKVWQTYFNERFEFYGRYLQFVVIKQSTSSEDAQRGSVDKAKLEYDVFAMINLSNASAAMNYTIQQRIIDFGSINNPVPWYNDAFPYAYSFFMDSWQTRNITAELACKQFVGKSPGLINHKSDPTMDYDSPRRWGIIAYQDATRTGAIQYYKDLFARCGEEFHAEHEYNLEGSGAGNTAGAMTKMRAANVTTVLLASDGLGVVAFTAEAEQLGYRPEYIHAGGGGLDSNTNGRLYNANQRGNILGIRPTELPRHDQDQDWFRAYKEVDPDGEPDSSWFRSLQQLSGGIQWAGPNLTPETFWQGMLKQPFRAPDPAWSIGGGYRETLDFAGLKDLTYMDYVSLMWFDPEGDDPDSSRPGAYCHVLGGQRFKFGEIPERVDAIPWFDRDQCIYSPPKGVQG